MSEWTTTDAEPCDCGSKYCTGFKPSDPTRYIIPQHLSGECRERDATIAAECLRLAAIIRTRIAAHDGAGEAEAVRALEGLAKEIEG